MSTLLRLAELIAASAPMLLLCLLLSKANLSRNKRNRQFAMPIICLLYCVLAVVFLDKINTKLTELIVWLGAQIPVLGSLIETLDISKYQIYISNTALLLVFMVVKAVCLTVLNAVWGGSEELLEATTGVFYEHSEEYGFWFLKEKYRDLKKLYRVFYVAAVIISLLLLALSQVYPHWLIFSAVFYPCFGILLLGEAVFFLDGCTELEYCENILGDDDKYTRVTNLSKLRGALKQLFGDRMLFEGTENEPSVQNGLTDFFERASLSDDIDDRIIAEYFEDLASKGTRLNADYIMSTKTLLKGKSVLFCNPFYRDLTPYLFLPMLNALLRHQKCLIIAGRKSTETEVKRWIEEYIIEQTKTAGLWDIGVLGGSGTDCDIGILSFSHLYELDLLCGSKPFFEKVGFVILLEPSMILDTGQIGLELVVSHCEVRDKQVLYCMCDRNCDGLVDTLSHLLKQSITSVTATSAPVCMHSEMCWHSDGEFLHHRILPDIARYLGVGSELALVALKNQAPKAIWYSQQKFPVTDMKWILGQYFRDVCGYTGLPTGQEHVYEAIEFVPDIWGAEVQKNSFMIVEDEFCNIFEAVRNFITRAGEQAFVNIISEKYLLRDYMQYNSRVFLTDQKAIPAIVPDYARTERNTTLKLIMMMAGDRIPEEVIEKELRLIGCEYDNVYDTLCRLIEKHSFVGSPPVTVIPAAADAGTGFRRVIVNYYSIPRDVFEEEFGGSLKNAYYITEDEEENSSFIDAKLFGHIYQIILPGQFFTYDGKYYEVRSITQKSGVIVRRAADHINGRKYYRQLRKYHLEGQAGDEIATRTISDIEVSMSFYVFSVETEGYLEMNENNDFKTARGIYFLEENQKKNFDRTYKNKRLLKIKIPGAGEAVCRTICLLLSEVFRTVYPGGCHYLAAVTGGEHEGVVGKALYSADGSIEEDCVYIIEDSDLDLGLLESVDRNLTRLLGIVTDYLMWHSEKIAEPGGPEPKGAEVELPPEERKGIFQRIADFFKGLFGAGKKKKPQKNAPKPEILDADEPEMETETSILEESGAENSDTEDIREETPEAENPDTDASSPGESEESEAPADVAPDSPETHEVPANPANEEETEDGGTVNPEIKAEPTEYGKNCYLLYGGDEIDEGIAVEDALAYLTECGFDNNDMKRVRQAEKGDKSEDTLPVVEVCDFCGIGLTGVSYDTLADGRTRCNRCSSTAIHTLEEFRTLYRRIMSAMETFYDIWIGVPIKVRTADARTIAKKSKMLYKPTRGFNPRVLGFARLDKNGYSIYIENGSPRLAAAATIAHELTHIWQYINWDAKEKKRQYGKGSNRNIVYEGMAKWAEIQYLYLIGETSYARQQEEITERRNDAYGLGFVLYREKYPLSRGTELPMETPFRTEPPL